MEVKSYFMNELKMIKFKFSSLTYNVRPYLQPSFIKRPFYLTSLKFIIQNKFKRHKVAKTPTKTAMLKKSLKCRVNVKNQTVFCYAKNNTTLVI